MTIWAPNKTNYGFGILPALLQTQVCLFQSVLQGHLSEDGPFPSPKLCDREESIKQFKSKNIVSSRSS